MMSHLTSFVLLFTFVLLSDGAFLPPNTAATRWTSDMVLCYMDARSNLAMEALAQQHPSGGGELRSAGYPEALLPDGDAEGGPEFPLIFPGEREGVSTPRGGPLSRVRAVLRSARKTLDMRAALGEDEV